MMEIISVSSIFHEPPDLTRSSQYTNPKTFWLRLFPFEYIRYRTPAKVRAPERHYFLSSPICRQQLGYGAKIKVK